MSRLARKPIKVPKAVSVQRDGTFWIFKGPKGEIKKEFSPIVLIDEKELEGGEKLLGVKLDEKKAKRIKNAPAILGTVAAHLRNAIQGVAEGYEKKLLIEGVGYKAQLDGKDITLSLGFSHPVKIKTPEGIELKTEKNAVIVSGADKEAVGQMAALIRSKKPPEPYKGKGIRYENEIIRRKAGKKAATTA